ncbi:MAG TPA: type II secretion system protein [Rickettsiales bacterium]|nr:type II secretion system protein [Rickettsiales bacterium]
MIIQDHPVRSPYKQNATSAAGFTLVEMSIVLVVIGMLIGGVFAGKALVRQSQINSAVTAAQTYISTIASFKQKYNELPGDMADAQSYWGTASSACPPTYASPLTGTATCNGDGNGEIGVTGAWGSANYEMFLVWHHLANAQMIQGFYNGAPGSAGSLDHIVGMNCPESKLSGGGYGIGFLGIQKNATYWFDGNWGHQIVLGGYQSNNWPSGGLITSPEALAIDTKYDDGRPATGVISTVKPAGMSCASSSNAGSAVYDITQTGNTCALLFTTGY